MRKFNYRLMNKGSFLTDFSKRCAETTCPEEFVIWAGIAQLADYAQRLSYSIKIAGEVLVPKLRIRLWQGTVLCNATAFNHLTNIEVFDDTPYEMMSLVVYSSEYRVGNPFVKAPSTNDMLSWHDDLKARPTKQILVHPDAECIFLSYLNKRLPTYCPYRTSSQRMEHYHIAVVACLLAMDKEQSIVTKDDMATAIKMVCYINDKAASVASRGYEVDSITDALTAIQNKLLMSKTHVQHSDLYISCKRFVSGGVFSMCINLMHELGFIEKFIYNTGAKKKPTFYKATDKLRDATFISRMIKEIDKL